MALTFDKYGLLAIGRETTEGVAPTPRITMSRDLYRLLYLGLLPKTPKFPHPTTVDNGDGTYTHTWDFTRERP